MSDRILIMSPRPGRIERVLDVRLERPRQRNAEEFLRLRGDILEFLHFAGNPAMTGPAAKVPVQPVPMEQPQPDDVRASN